MPLFPASPPAPFPPSHIAYLPTHRGWRYQMLTLCNNYSSTTVLNSNSGGSLQISGSPFRS
ncbi:hypothetical protein BV25DRAFT_1829823 [Artomyces pyxidatus]|uniref:Uncharacterized protein n=1 Tax=Artomyces pyxidatus TaxID=48021 RepID=A0ACB8SQE2_9AGAM|nr:hypothetical protein BV25DRAFT_1829823 [Artomyces pyxidatus]